MIDFKSGMHSTDRGDLFSQLMISDQAKADLERRMRDPSRHYHTLHHLDLLWRRHRCYSEAEGLPASLQGLIALAIAYHDAVYVGGHLDNEEASASLWLEVSATACPLPVDDRHWVADTIRATANHIGAGVAIEGADARTHARQWVLDLDLTPLGELPAIFDDNMVLLGAEVPHLSAQQSKASCLSAIRHFASARPLYRCSSIARPFEDAARMNFNRYLPDERTQARTTVA